MFYDGARFPERESEAKQTRFGDSRSRAYRLDISILSLSLKAYAPVEHYDDGLPIAEIFRAFADSRGR